MSEQGGRILLAEDEEIARENLTHSLGRAGHAVTAVADGAAALKELESGDFDLVITDIRMPGVDGMRLLERVKADSPETEVIALTGYASIESAVEAMRRGAFQYLAKPVRLDEVGLVVAGALEKGRLRREVVRLRRVAEKERAPVMIGHSRPMRLLKKEIAQVASVDCTVLIQGETGTGKELVARSLHAAGQRAERRFLAINCASFSGELFANELFGHEKDAFTGARGTRQGLLEAADNGTFFLDEIGDLPPAMQAALLRVLEARTLIRVGGTREIPVDVRVVAATNRDIALMVEEGAFRRDLYHRLNVITLRVPPLCERRDDIPLLVGYFVGRAAASLGKKIGEVDDEVMELLQTYAFPGNVRELEHLMERAVAMCNGERIGMAHLPKDIRVAARLRRPGLPEAPAFDGIVSLEENERRYLAWVLQQAGGAKGKAAALLGLNRGSLWRKLKRLGLDDG